MPIFSCPNCEKALSIPDDLVGRQVRCSNCLGVFTTDSPPPGAPPADDRPARREKDEDEYDDALERRPRRDALPHRGSTVLTLGIVALASMALCGPFLMLPLGIPAWAMGAHDLRLIREGIMDRNGESNTKAGMICGMIAVILAVLVCLVYVAVIPLVILADK
jgi:hypothetical protein